LRDEALDAFLGEAGLGGEQVPAGEVSKDRFIFRNGAYRKLPASPPGLLFNGFFGWKTKWAILREPRLRSQGPEHETLASFFERRFGREIVEYALDPFVAGIYAGDPRRLLVEYAFPTLLAYERQYGSVIKGFIQNKSGARKATVSFREGMGRLPAQLAQGLHIETNAPVSALARTPEGRYRLETPQGPREADRVVLALPAPAAAALVQGVAPALAQSLAAVRYAPMAVVHTAWKRQHVAQAPNGFGGLHPRREGLFTAGHIWSSAVFAGKCPDDEVLFTSFVGGDQAPDKAHLPEDRIREAVAQELSELHGISQAPQFQHFYRWERAIPQYDEAMHAVHAQVAQAEALGLFACANWHGGISIPDCLRKGKDLAERLAEAGR
jgi:oxygen-dependent protoporphyrinogen oxidase